MLINLQYKLSFKCADEAQYMTNQKRESVYNVNMTQTVFDRNNFDIFVITNCTHLYKRQVEIIYL